MELLVLTYENAKGDCVEPSVHRFKSNATELCRRSGR
jgi:hypothetical protein